MRRIFGGANLPISSTSSSLASDSLSSPGPPRSATSPSPSDPYSSSTEPSEPTRKGWFGAVSETFGAGIAGASRQGHHARSSTLTSDGSGPSGASTTLASSFGNLPAAGGEEDEEEYGKLPFGAARLQSPPPSRAGDHGRSPGSRNHTRNGSRNGSDAHGGRVSALSGRGYAEGERPSTPAEEKDALMVELLSGQAIVEAKDFDILDWDDMQAIKKEHAVLANRIASLTRSVALETKLRDSAAKLVRLSAPASAASSTSSRPRATREQAEAQLATANSKLATLSTELYRVGWQESALRTRLLHHTAGVLALSIRRRDKGDQGLPTSPLPPPTSANGLQEATSPSPTANGVVRNDHRFDSASFFAGNREAVIPNGSRTSPSPWSSPQLLPPSGNGAFPSSLGNGDSSAAVKDLDAQVRELRTALAEAQSENGGLVGELVIVRKEEQSARAELAAVMREAGESRREANELRREVDQVREVVREVKDAAAGSRKELADAQRDAEDGRRELLSMRSGTTDSQRDIANARVEATELAKKLSMATLEQEEAEHRAQGAEEKVAELEDQLERLRQAQEAEVRRLRAEIETLEEQAYGEHETDAERKLRAEISGLTDERRKVTQSIGDVLRRHRTRAIVGPALRDLPPFDDTTDEADLPSYLASTLDSHFDRISTHVTSLTEELANTRGETEDTLAGVQNELRQAVEHRERWRGEAETHRRARETLEATHTELQARSTSQAERLTSLQTLEQSFAVAQAEDVRLRQELAALQAKTAASEAQLGESTKVLKPLQELWRQMPPLDTRVAVSNSDDLSVLRTAFEQPRRPMGNFLADVTTGGKFTVESLTERVRVLLAEDLRLVNKLVAFEGEKDTHRSKAEQATKLYADNKASLAVYQKQVKDLEERIEVSSNQEVTMLERLNDLTESLEQTRGEKRKAEAAIASAQTQARAVESDKAQLQQSLAASQAEVTRLSNRPDDSAKIQQLEAELQDVRDQRADLEEELEDAKKREQKQRGQLLDQLNTVEQEVSSLKTQLRQEQRKKGKA